MSVSVRLPLSLYACLYDCQYLQYFCLYKYCLYICLYISCLVFITSVLAKISNAAYAHAQS